MRFKKLLVIMVSIALCMCLCGCELFAFNTEELISPPALTGDMYPIGQALADSAGDNYTLKYPTSGERRSAVILEDIDSDGLFEAFAFYSTNDDETTMMHINVICQRNGRWVSAADQSIAAVGVERVDFCDIDGDGTKEILAGWEIYGSSEKQLSVYTFTQNTFSQRLLQQYTGFLCGDLDGNGENEIFVHLLNTSVPENKAAIYTFGESGIHQTAGCIMDSTVKTASEPVLSTLSTGEMAIYIDEIKGIGAITEVLCLSKGELINPLLDMENSFENTGTLRAASLSFKDINHDGVIEIPVASDLPSADGGTESLYYTNWCSFNGEKLTVKLITIVNTIDGYYLTLPNRMVGKIAVSKDTANHRRVFYAYDAVRSTVGERLFSITAYDIKKWEDAENEGSNLVEIYRNDTTVFAASVNKVQTVFPLTEEEIKEMFKMVE